VTLDIDIIGEVGMGRGSIRIDRRVWSEDVLEYPPEVSSKITVWNGEDDLVNPIPLLSVRTTLTRTAD
jgi:hypothetical protein